MYQMVSTTVMNLKIEQESTVVEINGFLNSFPFLQWFSLTLVALII